MLAYLELGEVETEGLHLPDQVLHLTVGDPARPAVTQRRRQQPQIVEQRIGCGIREVRVPQPGGGDPSCHQHQQVAMRLPVGRPRELREKLRMSKPLQLQPSGECGARRRRLLVECQRPADAGRSILEGAQHVVGLDLHGLSGDGRRHVWVAVAVSPDPAAELEVRRHLGVDTGTAKSRFGCPVERWRETEQRLVEHRHRRTHLVERVEAASAQQRGAPQCRDLLEQTATCLFAFAVSCAWVVPALHLLRDAAQRGHDSTPPRLGRVRGEHRMHLKVVQQVGDVTARHGAGRGGQRVLGRRCVGEVTGTEHAHAMAFLGEVHQMEQHGEGAGNLLGSLDGELVDDAPRLVAVATPPRVTRGSRSTSLNKSRPPASAMTSPSNAPSNRTSPRRRSKLSSATTTP